MTTGGKLLAQLHSDSSQHVVRCSLFLFGKLSSATIQRAIQKLCSGAGHNVTLTLFNDEYREIFLDKLTQSSKYSSL